MFNEKSILVLCVSWLSLVDRLLLLAQGQTLRKQVLCSPLLLSRDCRIGVYEKWRFSSIINSGENVEALAKKEIVFRRCVVMLREMKRMAEKHYYCLQRALNLFFIFSCLEA